MSSKTRREEPRLLRAILSVCLLLLPLLVGCGSNEEKTLKLYSGAGIRPPVHEIANAFGERHGVVVQCDYNGSEILLALGLLLMSLSPAATAVWLLAVGFLTYVARTEERLLLERFGDDYAEYKRDVGMWIPRGRSRR